MIIDSKMQFYEIIENDWQLVPEYEFDIPNGYKAIFFYNNAIHNKLSGRYSIGVVFDNEVQIYLFNNGWEILPEFEFNLPEGHKNVLGIGHWLG